MTYLEIQPDHVTRWRYRESDEEFCHQFDKDSIQAVNAAIAAQRPLLVRGETGVGKSQLAEAAAWELGRAFCRYVVDARTEPRDLLWRFDAVARLAEAQILGHRPNDNADEVLQPKNFLRPGPLWWAFEYESASVQKAVTSSPLEFGDNQQRKDQGWVLLIDEIDKAETDVPNGLLEALGAREFWPLDFPHPIKMGNAPPLIIITTNEERTLPNAFVRRCLVLHLALPTNRGELIAQLVRRAEAHFQDRADPEAMRQAAELTVKDREEVQDMQLLPLPGQAEYLDLMRAVVARAKNKKDQLNRIQEIAKYTLKKHPELLRQRGSDA